MIILSISDIIITVSAHLYYDRITGCMQQIEAVNNLDYVAVICHLHMCRKYIN